LYAFVRRSKSGTFLRVFLLIIIAEAIAIFIAWRMLDVNANRWIQQKTSAAEGLSQQAAMSTDWSHIDEIQSGKKSQLFHKSQQSVVLLTTGIFRGTKVRFTS
jgi:hypothetical protein